MILLDTHIWVWLVNGSKDLDTKQKDFIQKNEENGLGVNIISCWEVAKLVEYKRLKLECSLEEWIG